MQLNIGSDSDVIFASINIGEPAEEYGYFDTGELSETAGNLYLYVDGQEIGSVFFYREKDGRITATLGRYDPDREQWDEVNPLEIKERENNG